MSLHLPPGVSLLWSLKQWGWSVLCRKRLLKSFIPRSSTSPSLYLPLPWQTLQAMLIATLSITMVAGVRLNQYLSTWHLVYLGDYAGYGAVSIQSYRGASSFGSFGSYNTETYGNYGGFGGVTASGQSYGRRWKGKRAAEFLWFKRRLWFSRLNKKMSCHVFLFLFPRYSL